MSLTSRIEALTAYANEVTGESDTTLSDAVATLAGGYGQGGINLDSFLNGQYPVGEFVSNLGSWGSRNSQYIFSGCVNLTSIRLTNPSLGGGGYTFANCSNLKTIYWACRTAGDHHLTGCSNLETVVLPNCAIFYTQALANAPKLKVVDVGGSPVSGQGFIRAQMFYNDATLDTVILRSNGVYPLTYANSFDGTPFVSSGTGGTLYVPQALISSYQSATTWSTILGYTNNQILPIEGSIYETQYADGTPIE